MTMHFSLEEKVEALGLLEVDTNPFAIAEVYQAYQASEDERCKHFKYYKQYGDTFMYYTEDYINKTPIKELVVKDMRNEVNHL